MLGLASVAAPATLAAPLPVGATHARVAQHVQQLTIHITATDGTVWGTDTVRYTYHGRPVQRSTSQAVSTIAVPRGVTAHLMQQPYSASSRRDLDSVSVKLYDPVKTPGLVSQRNR